MAKNRILQLVITAFVLAALMALTAFAEVTGGFGAIGGVDESYKAAVATLNEAGNGLTIDTENAITLTEANNTGLAGLYAVSNDDFATQTIVYVYGAFADRNKLFYVWEAGEINPSTGNAVGAGSVGFIRSISAWNKYAPGYWNGGGYWTKYAFVPSESRHELTSMGAQQFDGNYKKVWFYNNTWDSALAEAAELAGEDEALLATYTATVDALYSPYFKAEAHDEFIDADVEATYNSEKTAFYNAVLNKTTNTADFKYAYTSEQIIPISEVNRFNIKSRYTSQGVSGYSEAFASKVIAFVYDPEKNAVVQHTGWTTAATMVATYGGTTRTIDFTNAENWTPAFPEEGYLVGLRILPWAGMNDITKFRTNVGDKVNPATYNKSFLNGREGVWFTGYSIDAPKTPKPTGLAIAGGKLTGTAAGINYEYAAVSSAAMLNGTALTYTSVTNDTTFTNAGLYAVRVAAVDGEYSASDSVILYVYGSLTGRKTLPNADASGFAIVQDTTDWVDGKMTGNNVATFTYNFPTTYYVSSHKNVDLSYVSAIDNATTEDEKKAALDAIAEYIQTKVLWTYAYDPDEVVKVSEFNHMGFRLWIRQGERYVFPEEVKSQVTLYVLKEDGTVAESSALVTPSYSGWGSEVRVAAESFVNLPTEGYIIGIKLIPFAVYDAQAATINEAKTNLNICYGMCMQPKYYSIDTPKAEKPEGLAIADGKLTNTVAGTVYEYALASSADLLNGTSFVYDTVTEETTFTAGLYSVRVAGTEGEIEASDAVYLHVEGTETEKLQLPNKTDANKAAFTQSGLWVAGQVSNPSSRVFNDPYRVFAGEYDIGFTTSEYYISSDSHINAGEYVTPIEDAGDNAAKETALNNIATKAKNISFKYGYDSNEIIKVSEFASLSYKLFIRQGKRYVLPEDTKSEVRLYVMDKDGKISYYTATPDLDITKLYSDRGYTIPVKSSDFAGLPSDGYVLGFEIVPFAIYNAQDATINTSESNHNICYTLCIDYDNDMYAIKTTYKTPVLAVQTGSNKGYAELTISNYSDYTSSTKFAYSTNEGATWTEFTGATLKFTEANKYYWVKALADYAHYESEVAIPAHPSAAVIYKGASLVLDGKIGVRLYFDVDKSVLGYTMIKVQVNSVEVLAKDITAYFEADGRTAYATVYVAPKDYNDATIMVSQLLVANKHITPGQTVSKSIVNSIPTMKVSDYFDDFYALVEAGDAACVAANDLVKALDAYCQNADAYFNKEAAALDSVVADTTAIDLIAAPEKSGKFTDGNGNTVLEHYSSALVLEDNVTIRHYFKWTPVEGKSLVETVATVDNGKTATFSENNVKNSVTKDNMQYLYVDIEGIDATNLDTQYTLTLTLGTETISVKYSALNYVKQTYANENAKLANLAKAIYNYSVEAEDYID